MPVQEHRDRQLLGDPVGQDQRLGTRGPAKCRVREHDRGHVEGPHVGMLAGLRVPVPPGPVALLDLLDRHRGGSHDRVTQLFPDPASVNTERLWSESLCAVQQP